MDNQSNIHWSLAKSYVLKTSLFDYNLLTTDLTFQLYIPVILEEGWVLYMWDMLGRLIHVLDPCSGPNGIIELNKQRHKLISSRLHDALFRCLNEFFAGWPTQKDDWGAKFSITGRHQVLLVKYPFVPL